MFAPAEQPRRAAQPGADLEHLIAEEQRDPPAKVVLPDHGVREQFELGADVSCVAH